MGAFGEKLRKQRELRGIELDAISNTTKISTRMLRALEDEHFDQLPGGVFNKGFVRAYARQIGLDEEEAVADYLAALRGDQPRQSNTNVPEFSAPATKPPVVAAPELRDQAPTESAPPNRDLPTNDSTNSKDSGNDHHEELRREDRRKLSRRYEERRIQNRRSKNEDRRDEDRRNKDRRSLPRASQRFRQKYPAGDPEPANESAAPIPWGKLALALLALTLLLALWNFRQLWPSAASPAVASSNQSPAPTPQPAVTQSPGSTSPAASPSPAKPLPQETRPAATTSAPPAPLAKTAPPAATASTSPANQLSPAASPAATPATSSAASVSKPPANPPQPGPKPPASDAASPAVAPVAAPDAAAKPPSTFTLQVRAEKTTWVSLTADGKLVAQETLIAPAHTSVRAAHEIVVKTGNAAGISFLLNGKEIPAQGKEGETKTYIFNATGLQVAP